MNWEIRRRQIFGVIEGGIGDGESDWMEGSRVRNGRGWGLWDRMEWACGLVVGSMEIE